jgi:hypothetical protein
MTGFAIPDGVHAVSEPDGRLVVLNERTGNWHALNRAGADLYQELERTADIDQVIEHLARRHRGVPPERIRDDVERVIAELVRRGLLESSGTYTRRPAAVMMAATPGRGTVPRRHRLVAALAFAAALVLLRLPFRISTSAVAALKRRMTGRVATVPEAMRCLAAARFVTRHHPGRVACLELSLTTVLAGLLLGRRIDWCFGFATDPQTFHAWIEVGGTPVSEPTDDPIPPTYRRVFRV